MSVPISAAFNRKVVPALLTTFSSIITEPKSFAPYLSAIWPMPGPCVTQELCTFSMLSKKIRASAWAQVFGDAGRVFDPQGCMLRLKRPANERGESTASVLLVANALQMLDPLCDRLDVTEHHR